MSVSYINNNGEILENIGGSIIAGNRGYLYGDGVFESIRIKNGEILNLDAHISRMLEGAKALKIRVPNFYNVTFFKQKIEELLQHSNITDGGRVRISLDRAHGGTYKPETNESHYFIEVYPLPYNNFELNSRGWEVDLYRDLKKQNNKLANFKTKNGLIYVMCSIAAQEKQLDDLLITNEQGIIIEGSSTNLFIVSNGVLYTPGLEDGCLAGVMRMNIINLALKNGVKVYECSIMPQNLLTADEIFLTNAIKGVIWVGGYRTKRYFNTIAKKFVNMLNEKR